MIGPWNCWSRCDLLLVTVVMSTVNEAVETWVPTMTICPVIDVVRPTATVVWPKSTSSTR